MTILLSLQQCIPVGFESCFSKHASDGQHHSEDGLLDPCGLSEHKKWKVIVYRPLSWHGTPLSLSFSFSLFFLFPSPPHPAYIFILFSNVPFSFPLHSYTFIVLSSLLGNL